MSLPRHHLQIRKKREYLPFIMAEACDICVGKDIWAKKLKSPPKCEKKNFRLLAAACVGHKNCAEIFIKEGADVNCSAESFMRKYRDEIRRKALHDESRLMGWWTVDSWTPLMYAATYGHIEVIKLLLAEGADINLVKENMTVMGMAATTGQFESLELLIEAGADVNMKIQQTVPPLVCAVQRYIPGAINHKRCVEILIKAGADVNAPFVNCPAKCLHDIVALPLDAGADAKLFPLHELVGSIQLERIEQLATERS